MGKGFFSQIKFLLKSSIESCSSQEDRTELSHSLPYIVSLSTFPSVYSCYFLPILKSTHRRQIPDARFLPG